MNVELIDVLDENGVLTGEVLPRSEVHKRGLWHRAIVVAIVNEKMRYYFNKEVIKRKKCWNV